MKKARLYFFGLLLSIALASHAAAPKYIFYFIGDGMGVGAVSLTQAYNKIVLGSDSMLKMMQFPYCSLSFTYSASSPVTDSAAAAGTALATGNKTNNGMLGVTPDSTAVQSIADKLHKEGFGVGLITTVSPDDATPAAFYAHQPHRSMFYEIGCDAAASGYEFIAGAGLRGLTDKKGKPTDLLNKFDEAGVKIVYNIDSLPEATESPRVLLLARNPLSANELGFVIDSIPGQMNLAQMTTAAIDHLTTTNPDRFFLMVEGGSIDHAGHSNDPSALVMETIGFDKALRIAYDFYLQHPDETLIVVTADHETGGLALANHNYHYDIRPAYLSFPRMSKDAMIQHVRSMLNSKIVLSNKDFKDLLTDRLRLYSHIPVTAEENEILMELCDKSLENRANDNTEEMYHNINAMIGKAYEIISKMSGSGWTTGDHSGAPVPVFTIGQGAEQFASMQDNTDIPKKILSIALQQQ
ncbi:MAG: alkaline phosphatase [Bacteroides sp.]|nr:alkaline phosphatase [Bacteroides sp.]